MEPLCGSNHKAPIKIRINVTAPRFLTHLLNKTNINGTAPLFYANTI